MHVLSLDPKVRYSIIASGLAHLSLMAIFVVGPKFNISTAKRPVTEVTLITRSAEPKTDTISAPARPRTRVQPPQPTVVAAPASENAPAIAPESESDSAPAANTDPVAFSAYEMEVASRLNALKRYPEKAKRMRQQGRVMVRFKLARNGHVLAREIVEPSGHAALNEAALSLLSEVQGFKPFPEKTTHTSWVFTVPIEYRL